jgi:putative nucleotidyltransferase with HDIG domain
MPSTTLPRYVAVVAVCGIIAICHAVATLYYHPIGWRWTLLALLTLVSGSATVRLPSLPATISISETFVFTSVLLFGPSAGTLTVALDAFVISVWLASRGHPFYRLVFNITALPLALWLAAHIFYLVWDTAPLHSVKQSVEITSLLPPLALFTAVYFLLNSWMIAVAIALERHVSPLQVWRKNLAWLSLNYVGGASVAALLVSYTRNIDYAYIAVLPLLAILYFTFAVSMGRVEDANRHLGELNHLYMSTIETLAMAIDAKDQITHGHIRRVQQYAVTLARQLGVTDSAQISAIEAASLLHDMGKLAVPEYILNKPGRLTPAEFEKMKLHASVGADILSAIPFPYPVVPIVRHHHENWDGTGYPDGLRGTDIPIGARILSVVDCFDALTSDRPYRPRLADSEAIRILVERRGSMYDPWVVDTFVLVHDEIAPALHATEPETGGLAAITGRIALGTSSSVSAVATLDNISSGAEEMLILYDLARALSTRSSMREVGETVSAHLKRIIPAATIALFVFEALRDELLVVHASGEHAGHFTGLRIPRGQRLSGWVAANLCTILNSDPVLDLGESARSLHPRLRSSVSTPLVTGTTLIGVISAYSTVPEAFNQDHARILEVIARHAAQPIRAASACVGDTLRGESHDRDYAADTISQTVPTASLSIVLVTLNHLKEGMESTEEAQFVFAARIRSLLRESDVLFRHSSNDFIAFLPQTDANAADSIAQRIVSWGAPDGPSDTAKSGIQVAVGRATAPHDGGAFESLIAIARQRQVLATKRPHPPSVH